MSEQVYLGYKASSIGAAVAGGIVAAALTHGPLGKRALAALTGLLAMFVGTDLVLAGAERWAPWLASERLIAVLLAIGGMIIIETWHRLLTRAARRVDEVADHLIDRHIGGDDRDKPA